MKEVGLRITVQRELREAFVSAGHGQAAAHAQRAADPLHDLQPVADTMAT